MKIIDVKTMDKDRIVHCPKGDFISHRFLLKKDNMGFTVTKTDVKNNGEKIWHYPEHLEACYCKSGSGKVINCETKEEFEIKEDVMYVLDKHEKHIFSPHEDTVLICIFNPPLNGKEVHDKNNCYRVGDSNE